MSIIICCTLFCVVVTLTLHTDFRLFFCLLCRQRNPVDVKQEKQHNDLIHGVENFSPNSLKRIDTLEKVILPNAEGMLQKICTSKIAAMLLSDGHFSWMVIL